MTNEQGTFRIIAKGEQMPRDFFDYTGSIAVETDIIAMVHDDGELEIRAKDPNHDGPLARIHGCGTAVRLHGRGRGVNMVMPSALFMQIQTLRKEVQELRAQLARQEKMDFEEAAQVASAEIIRAVQTEGTLSAASIAAAIRQRGERTCSE